MTRQSSVPTLGALTVLAMSLASGFAQAASTASPNTPNLRPAWLGPVTTTHFDGDTDDLLTAGLGKSGLASAVAPTVSVPPPPRSCASW